MSDSFDLTDRIALVTGAGRGIGREIARALARSGAHIAIAELDPATGEDARNEIQSMGRRAMVVPTDVCNPRSVEAMVDQVEAAFGPIDILVNNAGIVRHVAALETTDDDWLKVIDVNVNGVFWCSRAVAKYMVQRRSGSIISIASMSGMIVNKPQPQTSYNVSKAGVIMMTKSLAAEWAPFGVRVNCVSPGYIDTEMSTKGVNEEWRRIWLEMTPVGRTGVPAEIAQAVLFLASDSSSFATGSNLVVDGGYTVW